LLLLVVYISYVESLKMAPPPGLKPAKERFATTSTTASSALNGDAVSSPPNSSVGPSTFTILKRAKSASSRSRESGSREIGEMRIGMTTPYTVDVTHGSGTPTTRRSWRNGLGVHTQVVTTLVDENGQYSSPTHISIPAYRVKYAPKGYASEIRLTESDWSTLRYGGKREDDKILN
ncbi:hypothetical protein PENTCL1PPCAC_19053, partial [Pristionchus entomophagus]